MRDDETVIEVRADAELEMAVPLAMGSNVGKGVEDPLRSADEIRHLAAAEARDVEKEEDVLRIEATVEPVFRLPHPSDGDSTPVVRTVLRTTTTSRPSNGSR